MAAQLLCARLTVDEVFSESNVFVLTVSALAQVAALKTMAIQGGPTYSLSQQPWAQPGKICLRKRHWHHTVIHQNSYSEC